MKNKTIDELNNLSLEELTFLEGEVYAYWQKVKAVMKFTEQCEKED